MRLPRAGLLKRLEKDLVDPPIQFRFGVFGVVRCSAARQLTGHGTEQ